MCRGVEVIGLLLADILGELLHLFQGIVHHRGNSSLWPLSKNREDVEGCVSPLAIPFAFSAWLLLTAVFSKATV